MSELNKNILIKSGFIIFLIGFLLISYLKKPSAEVNQIPPKRIKDTTGNAYLTKTVEEIKARQKKIHIDKNNPPKDVLEYAALCDRFDFECEKNPVTESSKTVYGFEYSLIDTNKGIYDIKDNSRDGNNEIVKYCHSYKQNLQKSEGVILSGLIPVNEEKTKEFDIWNPDGYDIFLMPRIRIDSVFASNLENRDYPVCMITVTNESDDTLKCMNLQVRNFFEESNLKYDGEYKDEFTFFIGEENLRIQSDSIKYFTTMKKNKAAAGNYFNIEIYYYGFCNMWIDYVRVENEIAHQLLTKKDAGLIDKLKKVWM